MSFKENHLGRFTSSRIKYIINSGKLTKTNETEIETKVSEIKTGEMEEFWSPDVEWGKVHEPVAVEYYMRKYFELKVTNVDEDQVFIPYGGHSGGTPDGLLNDDGTLEVKCPSKSKYHTKALRIGMPKEQGGLTMKQFNDTYFYQIQAILLFSEREWTHFVSFDPRHTGKDRMIVKRINRDEKAIEQIKRCLDMAIERKELMLASYPSQK